MKYIEYDIKTNKFIVKINHITKWFRSIDDALDFVAEVQNNHH